MGRKKVKNSNKKRKHQDFEINQIEQIQSQYHPSPATTSSTPPENDGNDQFKKQEQQAVMMQYLSQLATQYKSKLECQQLQFSIEELRNIGNHYKEVILDHINKIYSDCLNHLKKTITSGDMNSAIEEQELIIDQVDIFQKSCSFNQIIDDLKLIMQVFIEKIKRWIQEILNGMKKDEAWMEQFQLRAGDYTKLTEAINNGYQCTLRAVKLVDQILEPLFDQPKLILQLHQSSFKDAILRDPQVQRIIATMKIDIYNQSFQNASIHKFLQIEQELDIIETQDIYSLFKDLSKDANNFSSEEDEHQSSNENETFEEQEQLIQANLSQQPLLIQQKQKEDLCQNMNIDQIVNFIQGNKNQQPIEINAPSSSEKKKKQKEFSQMSEQDLELLNFENSLNQTFTLKEPKIKPTLSEEFKQKLRNQIETNRKQLF